MCIYDEHENGHERCGDNILTRGIVDQVIMIDLIISIDSCKVLTLYCYSYILLTSITLRISFRLG